MNPDVLAFCRQEALFSPGDRVTCAVSGGADSMALLHCLTALAGALDIQVSAAHFNHQLRGAESDGDAAFVRDYCARAGIPFYLGSADVAGYARQTGLSLETAAREKRYAFLQSLPCDKIAVAHNADDNAETVLLHWLRGSGLRGLCGIPVKNGRVVRPLLGQTRGEILAYLTAAGLSWREDSTNAQDDCLRNRLRHNVLPLLTRERPELPHRLTGQCAILRQEDDLLDAMASEYLVQTENGYDIAALRAAPLALRRRALRQLVGKHLPQDVALCHIFALLALVENEAPSARCSLPNGLTAQRYYGSLRITTEAPLSFAPLPLALAGVTEVPELGLKITCEYHEKWKKAKNTPFHFAVRYDKINVAALFLRPRQTGDEFLLPNGHRKSLKKLCIDRKIPRTLRQRLVVLADAHGVLAVSAFGVSGAAQAVVGSPALCLHVETSKE